MANHSSSSDVDPQELARSREIWGTFTTMTKYGIVAIAVLLALMALFLV